MLQSLKGSGRVWGEWGFSVLVPAAGSEELTRKILLPPLGLTVTSHFPNFFYCWFFGVCFFSLVELIKYLLKDMRS